MDVAELKQSQRLRILNALETIRDEAMALAGLCLIANTAPVAFGAMWAVFHWEDRRGGR